ncbi:unnamed protein product [Durusdinium trenchii]|uniref:Uncharacterized protein n=2 Tax=Durusdinium trenchii TaxID=1381693 RepID=A0ABP0JD70_9DINO
MHAHRNNPRHRLECLMRLFSAKHRMTSLSIGVRLAALPTTTRSSRMGAWPGFCRSSQTRFIMMKWISRTMSSLRLVWLLLKVLKLFKNSIADDCVAHFEDLLKSCRNLREVHLSHNNLSHHGVLKLAECVARSSRAEPLWLRVEHNSFKAPGELLKDLEKNYRACPRLAACKQFWCSRGSPLHVPFLGEVSSRLTLRSRSRTRERRDRLSDSRSRRERREFRERSRRRDSRERERRQGRDRERVRERGMEERDRARERREVEERDRARDRREPQERERARDRREAEERERAQEKEPEERDRAQERREAEERRTRERREAQEGERARERRAAEERERARKRAEEGERARAAHERREAEERRREAEERRREAEERERARKRAEERERARAAWERREAEERERARGRAGAHSPVRPPGSWATDADLWQRLERLEQMNA